MGKYFGKGRGIGGRPTNILVNLYKIKYENYYGCKLTEKEEIALHSAIVYFFKSHSLELKDEGDKDWFIENVLDIIFKRYDDLGYSSAEYPRFVPIHLATNWLIDNIINNVSIYE